MAKSKPVMNINDLQPDTRNANKGTQRGRGMVEASLREVGAGRSIVVDKDGRVIAGNKTLEAAADIGLEIQVVHTDGKRLVVVQRDDLDLSDDTGPARKLAYLDNRASDVGLAWDAEQMLADLNAGFSFNGVFDTEELDAMLAGLVAPEPVNDSPPDVSKASELQKKYGTKENQLWTLGEHKLLIADCTVADSVAMLMNGEKGNAYIGDLPYGTTGLSWDAVIPFDVMWTIFETNLNKDAAIVSTASQPFTSALISSRFGWFKHAWVWNKKLSGNFLHAKRQPMKIHEDIVVFSGGDYCYNPIMSTGKMRTKGGNGASKIWDVDLTADVNDQYYPVSIVEVGNTDRKNIEHPTEKPVELFCYLIETYTKRGEIVCDYTVGMGTTLMACENTGRQCRGTEINPGFAAVTIHQWETATGEKASCAFGL